MRFFSTLLPDENAQRLDTVIAEKAGITRSQAKKLIETGKVLVNGDPLEKAGRKPKPGEQMLVELEMPESPQGLPPEPYPLSIPYADDYLAVVEKPAGMVVYPGAGHSGGTLLNALVHHTGKLATIGGPLRPGVVHRLDKDTSGIMIVALEDSAYYGLLEQFRTRSIKRRYAALVWGAPKEDEGVITLAIGRSGADRKKMSTRTRRGKGKVKEAVTSWKVLRRFRNASLIEATLGTGRTHQIRVHFASIGHPVLGDRTYGKKTSIELAGRKIKIHIPRQMLHAKLLGFVHPVTGKHMEFESPLPEDMAQVLEELEV
ncbi:MAG: RluA family pseudouridine synthase [Nitrospiraceae bacterium]|nr:RluA family pseudouridine synthase [Nitrospiraceae bacterium]